MPRRSILIGSAAAILAIAAVLLLWPLAGENNGPPARSGTVGQSGEAAIGGSFTLVDQNGETRTDEDFRGRYMLVFFGYTNCPDFCPTSLQTISNTLDVLGEDAANLQPVFISIDPARDTVEQMNAYSEAFHPKIVYLTGNDEQVAKAARAYRVYYSRREIEGGVDAYIMDHSTFTYLMGPDGKFIDFFEHGLPADEMAKRIRRHMNGTNTN
jgi:protein SCO1/2